MVIKYIHNKLLRPEGSAQLFHLWERIDLIGKLKVYFYSGSYSVKYKNKNAETTKNAEKSHDLFDNLVANLNKKASKSSINFGYTGFIPVAAAA